MLLGRRMSLRVGDGMDGVAKGVWEVWCSREG